MQLVDIALGYAQRGWPVLPLVVGGKVPATNHGLHDATTEASAVRSWWERNPNYNIGIATGVVFDVLDLDGPGAEVALDQAYESSRSPDDFLIGPTVATPRGYHLYVAPTGRGNTVNVGGLKGVDWRGVGGYVVAPGSRRDDGQLWRWEFLDDPLHGHDAPIRAVPPWLLDLLTRKPEPSAQSPIASSGRPAGRYAEAAIERACGRLAAAPEGERNHALNREAHGLGRLAGAGLLDPAQAAVALHNVAVRIGLTPTETEATIRSGITAGMRNPKSVA